MRTWMMAVALAVWLTPAPTSAVDPVTVHVFHRNAIHFSLDDTTRTDTATVTATDRGREINRTLVIPSFDHDVRILARVTTHPIPMDAASVHDKWDRAGNVRLLVPGEPDVEILKFITAYGGRTSHEMDVTHLAPLLVGECTFRGFVDTWVSPAWKMDFSLVFEPIEDEEPPEWMKEWIEEADAGAPDWVQPLLYESITRERMETGPIVADVTVPAETKRAAVYYLVSGHCTDGRGADEFETKDNVVAIDGMDVHRFRPWRSDCRRFRDVNPYCRRWFDGSWSADFDRSGWCPGDAVSPEVVDVTEHLPPGEHAFSFRVEDVRPDDESGHGYWRVSAVVVGWVE